MSAVSVKLTQIVPPMIVILLLIAIWWIVVVKNDSEIFPTPWQVVTGAFELAEDGTLWEHIGASLFRVGTGFGLAFLVAVPLGLWMGWIGGAFDTLNLGSLPIDSHKAVNHADPAHACHRLGHGRFSHSIHIR